MSPERPCARLVIVVGRPGHLLLRGGVYTIGRGGECDLVLDDGRVSRCHARVEVAAGAVTVVDNESRNGTFLDGERVTRAAVRPGAQVQFGGVVCACEGLSPADEPPTVSELLGPAGRGPALSPAEERVFELLLCGLAEKLIARRLVLSPHTVHNHVKRIYRAFGVHSRPELLVAVSGRPARRG